MTKRFKPTKEDIAKLYESDAFYEHGDNPALKRFMEISVENLREGRLPDYRTYVVEKYTKLHYSRNWEDFLQNDLKIITFPRSLVAFTYASWMFLLGMRYCRNFLPLGQHGITKLSQCQFYHLYGPIGTLGVLAMPAITGYLWYKTAKFTAKKFYYNVLLGDSNWIYELEKQNPTSGQYHFNDAVWSCDESFNDLGRAEMAKKKVEKPEWAKWK